MRWSDLAVLVIFSLPLAAQPIGGGIFGKMPTGTVTSVGLSASTPLQVSGSPITGSGTMSLSFQGQSANTVLAGPASGGAAAPAFRALVAADIPSTSGLTTTGAVPFVTSSGTLGQDGTNLVWDDTNNRLGIGTASPGTDLDVRGNSAVFRVANGSAGTTFFHVSNAAAAIGIGLSASGVNNTRIGNGGTVVYWSNNSSTGIGPSNTAPTGTLSVVDRTAVTGASLGYFGTDGTNTSATYSKWIFRLGAVQGSNNLTEWQSNAGALMTGIAPNGGLLLTNTAAPTLANGQLTIHIVSDTQVTFTLKGSDGVTRTNTLTMI